MNGISIFGGTGSIGKIIVEKLKLEKIPRITVLSRNKINLSKSDEQIVYQEGDVLNYEDVERTINNKDIIIISLGYTNSTFGSMSKGTKNILKAMKQKDCTRLICLSAQGAGDSWNHMPESFKTMVKNSKVLTESFNDHTLQEEMIKETGLDWTIIRPTEIVESINNKTEYIVNDYRPDLIFKIEKEDVASFITSEVKNKKYVKRVAMITC